MAGTTEAAGLRTAKTAAEVLALTATARAVLGVHGVEGGLAGGPPVPVAMADVTEYGIHECYGVNGVRLRLRTTNRHSKRASTTA
jgi:hypothetical protein